MESGQASMVSHFVDSIGQEFTLTELLPITIDSTIAHYYPYEAVEVLVKDTMILYLGEKYTFSIYSPDSSTTDVDDIILQGIDTSFKVAHIDGYFKTIDGFTRYIYYVKFSFPLRKMNRQFDDPQRLRKAQKWYRKNRIDIN